MVKVSRSEWKQNYFKRLTKNLADYEKCFVVGVDNVRSKQMQQIRHALRGEAEIVMGKNTMMRKIILRMGQRDENLAKLLPHIKENVGFVFTKGDLNQVRERILENRVQAPAKAGAIAQCDVVVPAQNTGLGPEKTSFFQALNILTKITRGTIEIMTNVDLIKKDTKVGPSEAALLTMLKIEPFSYGLVVKQVYDQGSIYAPAVLDITEDIIRDKMMQAIANVASLSLAINNVNAASMPHLIVGALKKVLAISLATDYTFPESEKAKEYLADPSKFQVACAATAAPAASAPTVAAAAEKAPESDEESDDMALGLFD